MFSSIHEIRREYTIPYLASTFTNVSVIYCKLDKGMSLYHQGIFHGTTVRLNTEFKEHWNIGTVKLFILHWIILLSGLEFLWQRDNIMQIDLDNWVTLDKKLSRVHVKIVNRGKDLGNTKNTCSALHGE